MSLLPEFIEVLESVKKLGDTKYGENSFLNDSIISARENFSSMARHFAEGFAGKDAVDAESGEHPWAHLAFRGLMMVTLWKRGIKIRW